MAFCTSCGQGAGDGATYCTACGTPTRPQPALEDSGGDDSTHEFDDTSPHDSPVADASSPQVESGSRCHQCHEEIASNAIFCTTCGAVVGAPLRGDLPGDGDGASGHTDEPSSEVNIPPASPPDIDDHPADEELESDASGRETLSFQRSGCRVCGERLEPGAAFCTACGHPATAYPPPAGAATPLPESQPRRNAALLISAALLVVMMGATAVWFFGFRPSDEPPAAAAVPGSTTTPASTTTPTSLDTGQSCLETAIAMAGATELFVTGLATHPISSLAISASVSVDLLPGASAYTAGLDALAAEAETLGCDDAEFAVNFKEGLNSATEPTQPVARIAMRFVRETDLSPRDALSKLGGALGVYPQPAAMPATTASPIEPEPPRWVVILSSLNTAENSQSDAQARAATFSSGGIPALTLLTDDYASLTPGYWAVYAGPFGERSQAQDYCTNIKATVPDCYQRYVQVMPSTDPPYGACGPYGRVDFLGSSPVQVLGRPETGRGEVGSFPGNTANVLVAGPAITTDTSWTPIVFGAQIGWVETISTVDNPGCPRDGGNAVSCASVADGVMAVFRDTIAAADAVDAGSLDQGAPDRNTRLAMLVASSRGQCTATQLNEVLAARRTELVAEGTIASLVLELLFAEPVIRDA